MRPSIQKLLSELGEFGQKNIGYFNIPAATGKFFYNLVANQLLYPDMHCAGTELQLLGNIPHRTPCIVP